MSCGIASVMMCAFKINKIAPGKTAVHVEKDIYKKYQAASGNPYNSTVAESTGTGPWNLVAVLNQLNCGSWTWDKVAPNKASTKIIDTVGVTTGFGPTVNVNPIIVGVDWDRGGAHWVVIDTVREFLGSHYATVCDPWDTNVHVQKLKKGDPFVYEAGQAGFAVDFWGSHKGQSSPYASSKRGQVKIWGIIHRT
jgi:hypothetical protein